MLASLCACGTPQSSPVEDFRHEFDDGEVTITGYTGSDLEIVIPSVIDERPVTEIGSEAFNTYDLKSVVIPEGVTTLGSKAFANCDCLENIVASGTLQILWDTAISDTLWWDNQPEGVVYLNNTAVGYKGDYSCDITIKDGTVSIVDKAFMGRIGHPASQDNSYSSIHIPASVTYIGDESVGYAINYSKPSYYGVHGFYERITGFTIYGKEGSEAENYAAKNGFNFVNE